MAKAKDVRMGVDVKLDLIRIDGETQHRLLETDWFEHYKDLMKAGTEFPAVEVVFDGKDYWLWDGFHRYWASKELGKKAILANVQEGTLRDAVWLSFSANKDHGIPRPLQFTRDILRLILDDKNWRRRTQKSIADHIGVSEGRVSQLKKELMEEKRNLYPLKKRPPEATNADSGKKKSKKSNVTEEEKKPKKPVLMEDKLGQKVPEKLGTLWVGREFLQRMVKELDKMRNEMKRMWEKRDKRIAHVRKTAFEADMGQLRARLNGGVFYCVCPACGGNKCKMCGRIGLITKHVYDLMPEEFKK